jgi:hypothetical protein
MTSTVADDFSASYLRIQCQLIIILGSILIGIGSVSTVLSCIVFAQKTMRQNLGSIYFIAYNLTSLLFFFAALSPLVLSNMFNLNPSSYNVPYCKLYLYGVVVFTTLSRYYLVLTSVDRTLITSSNALTRQRSTHRLVYWSIGAVALIILLHFIHLLVYVDIYELYPGDSVCYFQPGSYTVFFNYSNLVVAGLVPWLLLSVFAILTLRNLSRVRIRPVNAVPVVINTRRSKDCQFAVMLLVEIVLFFLTSASSLLFGIYLQITQYQTRLVNNRHWNNFFRLYFIFSVLYLELPLSM